MAVVCGMTDQERLQKLFQAALNESPREEISLKRAFPAPVDAVKAEEAPKSVEAPAEPAPAPVPICDFVVPMPNAGLDDATSTELGVLLDEQNARKTRKRRREWLATAAVLLLLGGGGFGWFVHSPERVRAFGEAMHDIRSAGDIAGMVGKYRVALDRIATRSEQIGDATESMGVSSDQSGEKDVYMDAEMKEMMGGEGKTVGQRNGALQASFSHMKEGVAATGISAPKN